MEPNLWHHFCQQEQVVDRTDCKSHGVLGDKEERDACGFIPKMKEDSKSWLLTFAAGQIILIWMLQLNKNA